MNAVLSVMAVNRMLMSGSTPHLITVYYHHKVEALRMVRKVLHDAKDPASVSDDALIAIVVLSILEVCDFSTFGNRSMLTRSEQRRIHCCWTQTLRGL